MNTSVNFKLRLPQFQRVSLKSFSLYAANPDAEFECSPGVTCLIGANGIGKSTLLSAVNFCLTGVVADPSRKFESIDEYYRFTRDFSANYFRGRIEGNDADDAQVTLTFSIADRAYSVTRGLFEPEELRALSISEGNGSQAYVDDTATSRIERHQAYKQALAQDVGVSSFEEFAFLQLFVFTFDEQRRTLFWDQRVLERVLYRAFGMEPDMAKRADALRREYQQEDSRVRNYQWEATRMRKRINEIRAKARGAANAQQEFDSLSKTHAQLSAQFALETDHLKGLEDELADANLRLEEGSLKEASLRDEYAQLFNANFHARPPLSQHPLIVQSIIQKSCGLCGSELDFVEAHIRAHAAGQQCPLCDSELKKPESPKIDLDRLKAIDQQIAAAKEKIVSTLKSIDGYRRATEAARISWSATKAALDEFDRSNSANLDALRTLLSDGDSNATLEGYRLQLEKMEQEKQQAYDQRQRIQDSLTSLQRTLATQYLQAEEQFVPQFSKLAERFLGMPLNVKFEASGTGPIKLVVSVRGSERRQQHYLSESQRFFLDIALRMALTTHIAAPNSRGGMLIDTPEGSLDLAYEKRAGDMLAMFAVDSHRILMTANLNSSKLLLALARACGKERMSFVRMTDWAELSEVQREEEQLFEDAYSVIETALAENNAESNHRV